MIFRTFLFLSNSKIVIRGHFELKIFRDFGDYFWQNKLFLYFMFILKLQKTKNK